MIHYVELVGTLQNSGLGLVQVCTLGEADVVQLRKRLHDEQTFLVRFTQIFGASGNSKL